MHSIFQSRMSGHQSLSGNLLDPNQYKPAQLETNIDNLSVLPVGPTPPNPSELLHSQRFQHLLAQMKKDFDLVILDSSPLIVTDAAILGSFVDGALMVVRALKTDKRSLVQAIRKLRQVNTPLVGSLFNGHELKATEVGYKGYYSAKPEDQA